jgi:hypothetical protein
MTNDALNKEEFGHPKALFYNVLPKCGNVSLYGMKALLIFI